MNRYRIRYVYAMIPMGYVSDFLVRYVTAANVTDAIEEFDLAMKDIRHNLMMNLIIMEIEKVDLISWKESVIKNDF